MSIHKQWANAKVGQGRYYTIDYASMHCNSSGKTVGSGMCNQQQQSLSVSTGFTGTYRSAHLDNWMQNVT